MRQLASLLGFVLLSSCCTYTDQDFAFSTPYINLLHTYHPGDTLFFSSQTGDWDTLTVETIDTFQTCGSVMVNNHRSVAVTIRHLPYNKWTGGTELNQNQPPTRRNQEIIAIEKTLKKPGTSYFVYIQYRDFEGELNLSEDTVSDSVWAAYGISQYWSVSNEVASNKYSTAISRIFWTEKYGLTGYKLGNGQFYKIQKDRL